jgi:hypothetical protein
MKNVTANPWDESQARDEHQWAKYWVRVFEKYNSLGEEYSDTTTKVCRANDGSNRYETCVVSGLSHLVQQGLKTYQPDVTSSQQP